MYVLWDKDLECHQETQPRAGASPTAAACVLLGSRTIESSMVKCHGSVWGHSHEGLRFRRTVHFLLVLKKEDPGDKNCHWKRVVSHSVWSGASTSKWKMPV